MCRALCKAGVFATAALAQLLGQAVGLAEAGQLRLYVCGDAGYGLEQPGDGLTSSASRGLQAVASCGNNGVGLALSAPSPGSFPRDASAGWKVTAPQGVAITSIYVLKASSFAVGDGNGWWGEFYWNGGPGADGRSGQIGDNFSNSGCCSEHINNRTIGWFMACAASKCGFGNLSMAQVQLTAEEDTAPALLPATQTGNLWTAAGWVRGRWPAGLAMSDASGVCRSAVVLGSQTAKPLADQTPDQRTWQQCSQTSLPASFDTSTIDGSWGVGVGVATLTALATNAAGVTAHPSKAVALDNTTPTIALSGPTDAPSTAGTQYVTAIAGGSPSGIARIVCSVDGGPEQSFAGASARIPVSGIGQHTTSCYAENNAVDPAGVHGQSTRASWALKIGVPTEFGIGFRHLVGLRCTRTRVRVRVPGHWVTVHRHGIPVWVKTRSVVHTRTIVRCRPRTISKRVVVVERVRRGGHVVIVRAVKVIRVVVSPHAVSESTWRVAFGRKTQVSGWLGTTSGIALAGRRVDIVAAPDNGSNAFSLVAQTTTGPDGTWNAPLGAGPSRVVEAFYGGDGTTEASASRPVHVVVPARIELLSVTPRHVGWGGTVHITGQLVGGYVPATGALVRLRIGIGRNYVTYGVEHVFGGGRFTTTYTFGLGTSSVHRHYFFQIATLPEGDYPFAPGSSNRKTVAVGGS